LAAARPGGRAALAGKCDMLGQIFQYTRNIANIGLKLLMIVSKFIIDLGAQPGKVFIHYRQGLLRFSL
jgi:hypothetical protein